MCGWPANCGIVFACEHVPVETAKYTPTSCG